MGTKTGTEQHSAKYFLDTSTQISRHWSDEETNRKVRNDLMGKKLRCSIYVEREYRCRVLNSLINLHTFIMASNDVQEAEERLEKCKHKIHIDNLVYNVGKRLLKKYNSRNPLLKYLRRLIEADWENFFYDGGIPKALCDMTNCTRGADAPKYKQGYYLTIPSKCPKNCNISDFWKSKGFDLKNLATIDQSLLTSANDPKGTMRTIKNEATEVLSGKSPHGDTCRKISDTVISIEARDSYPGITIHTMDDDFELIKRVLKTKVRFFKA